jgi:heme exporter protein C
MLVPLCGYRHCVSHSHDKLDSVKNRNTARIFAGIWLLLTLAVLGEGYRQAIFVSPAEATMGDVFRIFFYHVPNASLALVPPYINLLGSLGYLFWRTRNPQRALAADALAIAAAEITLVLTSIGLITGMLWARPIWGIWWTWDERLTTYLLLWLLYASYVLLRRMSNTGQMHTLAAVLSVFAAVDVPITFMSIRWWRTQHPGPVLTSGQVDHAMLPAIFWNLAGWGMWSLFALALRYTLERRRQQSAAARNAALLGDPLLGEESAYVI